MTTKSSLEVACLLVNAGADVNVADYEGCAPLHAAAQSGYREVAELLLGSSASLDAQNETQETPLNLVPFTHPHPHTMRRRPHRPRPHTMRRCLTTLALTPRVVPLTHPRLHFLTLRVVTVTALAFTQRVVTLTALALTQRIVALTALALTAPTPARTPRIVALTVALNEP